MLFNDIIVFIKLQLIIYILICTLATCYSYFIRELCYKSEISIII